jgi:hypothetical protein
MEGLFRYQNEYIGTSKEVRIKNRLTMEHNFINGHLKKRLLP